MPLVSLARTPLVRVPALTSGTVLPAPAADPAMILPRTAPPASPNTVAPQDSATLPARIKEIAMVVLRLFKATSRIASAPPAARGTLVLVARPALLNTT